MKSQTTTNIKKDKVIEKIRKNTGRVLAGVFLLVVGVSLTTQNLLERKINDVSGENIVQAKEALSLENEEKYQKYIKDFNYTETMYQEDIDKFNKFNVNILEFYKKYLIEQNFKDERSDKQLLLEIEKLKENDIKTYFLAFTYDHYFNSIIDNGFLYLLSTNLYYGKDLSNDSKFISEMYKKETLHRKSLNEKGLLYENGVNNFIFEFKMISNMKKTIDNENLFFILKNQDITKNNFNIENQKNKILKEFINKKIINEKNKENISQEEYYHISNDLDINYMYLAMKDPVIMKKTFKIMRGTKLNIEKLKSTLNNQDFAMLDNELLIKFHYKNSELLSKLKLNNVNFNEKDELTYEESGNLILDEEKLRKELSGYNRKVFQNYYKK